MTNPASSRFRKGLKPKKKPRVYVVRNALGRYWREKKVVKKPPHHGWYKIGYSSYDGYLKSALWSQIRKMVLSRDDHKCRLCGELATQVHHHSYDVRTMLGAKLKRLSSLCTSCHHGIEYNADGTKRSLREANRVYKQLRRAQRAAEIPTSW